MKYAMLRQTEAIRDISAPDGGKMYTPPATAAVPATVLIHALRAADDQVMCTYVPNAADIAEPGRDWATLRPGEPQCAACAKAVQLAEREVAQ